LTNGTFFWCAQNENDLGSASSWFNLGTFQISVSGSGPPPPVPPPNNLPSAPNPNDPANTVADLASKKPVFSVPFNDPDGGTGNVNFKIFDSSQSSCTSGLPLRQGAGTTVNSGSLSTWTTSNPVLSQGEYFWCAQADDGTANSTWVRMGEFLINLDPSDPAGGTASNVNTRKPTLSAQFIDPDLGDRGVVNFKIKTTTGDCASNQNVVSGQTGQSAQVASQAVASWTAPVEIAVSGTFFWCAQSEDQLGGQSNWVEMGSFQLQGQNPFLNASIQQFENQPIFSADFSDPQLSGKSGFVNFRIFKGNATGNADCLAASLQSNQSLQIADLQIGTWQSDPLENGAFFWCAQNENADGQQSGWWNIGTFSISLEQQNDPEVEEILNILEGENIDGILDNLEKIKDSLQDDEIAEILKNLTGKNAEELLSSLSPEELEDLLEILKILESGESLAEILQELKSKGLSQDKKVVANVIAVGAFATNRLDFQESIKIESKLESPGQISFSFEGDFSKVENGLHAAADKQTLAFNIDISKIENLATTDERLIEIGHMDEFSILRNVEDQIIKREPQTAFIKIKAEVLQNKKEIVARKVDAEIIGESSPKVVITSKPILIESHDSILPKAVLGKSDENSVRVFIKSGTQVLGKSGKPFGGPIHNPRELANFPSRNSDLSIQKSFFMGTGASELEFTEPFKVSAKIQGGENERLPSLSFFNERTNFWEPVRDVETGKVGGQISNDGKEIFAWVDHMTIFAITQPETRKASKILLEGKAPEGFGRNIFSDVSEKHWAHAEIAELWNREILNGNPDGTFNPEKELNRAAFVTIVLRSFLKERIDEFQESWGLKTQSEKEALIFNDIDPDSWFAPLVALAKQLDVVGGYPDGTFRPTEQVNRVEAAKILINTSGLEIPGNLPASQFADVREGSWFAKFAGLFEFLRFESGTNFNPSKNLTRAQTAGWTLQVLEFSELQEGIRTVPLFENEFASREENYLQRLRAMEILKSQVQSQIAI